MPRWKHGRQGDIQDFADVEQAHRTDAVGSLFIILNLLKRDTQDTGDLCLAHVEREPTLAHSFADVFVDGSCALGRR